VLSGWFSTKLARAHALGNLGGAITPLILGPIAPSIVSAIGWRHSFRCLAGCTLILLGSGTLLLTDPPSHKESFRTQDVSAKGSAKGSLIRKRPLNLTKPNGQRCKIQATAQARNADATVGSVVQEAVGEDATAAKEVRGGADGLVGRPMNKEVDSITQSLNHSIVGRPMNKEGDLANHIAFEVCDGMSSDAVAAATQVIGAAAIHKVEGAVEAAVKIQAHARGMRQRIQRVVAPEHDAQLEKWWKALRTVVSTRRVQVLSIAVFIYGCGGWIPIIHVVRLASDRGLSSEKASQILMYLGAGSASCRVPLAWCADRFGRRRVWAMLLLLHGIVDLICAYSAGWAEQQVLLGIFAFVAGGLIGSLNSILITLPTEMSLTPLVVRLSVPVIVTPLGAGMLTGPFIAGAIRTSAGRYDEVLVFAAACLFTACGFFVIAEWGAVWRTSCLGNCHSSWPRAPQLSSGPRQV